MDSAPRFSVTIPAYNAESTLRETVESVRAQTFGDWELVICNDGSTDGTLALAESLAAKDSRIRVVTRANGGSGAAYNTAVRTASSNLLVMLSADDLLLPTHLEEFDAFVAANSDASIFTCNGYYEYPDGSRELSTLHEAWTAQDSCTLVDLLGACFFGIGAVYRREVFDAVGGFREDIYAEDYVFWLFALAKGFRHRYLDRPLSVHRRNWEQKSADALRMRQADVRAVEDVITTGLLTEEQNRAAQATLSRLRRNIRIRKILGGLLGPERSSQLINRLRRRRAIPAGARRG